MSKHQSNARTGKQDKKKLAAEKLERENSES